MSSRCSGQGGSYSTHSPSQSSTAGRYSHPPPPPPPSPPLDAPLPGDGRRVTASARAAEADGVAPGAADCESHECVACRSGR